MVVVSVIALSVLVGTPLFFVGRKYYLLFRVHRAKIERERQNEESMRQRLLDTELPEQIDLEWIIPYESLKIEGKLGGGGYGIVYRGNYHGTPVAVKVLTAVSAFEDVEKFEQEVRVLRSLRHPNIVSFMVSSFPFSSC